MTIVDLFRNKPEYPWEPTPRRRVLNAINAPYRAMCWLRATSISLDVVADLVGPRYGRSFGHRDSIKTYADTIRGYIQMAVQG